MVKETAFYDLLGANPTDSEDQLKKAYRKKALRLHPDKGGDPEAFKEVTHAYEVLSDPQQRDLYDQMGEAGLQSGAGGMGGGMDAQDLFSQLFGGGGGAFGGFGGGGPRRPQGPRKGKDLVHRVSVTLAELYLGKVKKLALQKHVICGGCEGRGGKEGAVKKCTTCNGQGYRVMLRQLGPMMQQVQQPCGDCDAKGEIIDPKHRCKVCSGKKVNSERKVLEVHIDRGMKGGQQITFNGESDQAPGTIPGDVVIVIEEKPHELFTRKGDDLYCEVKIDLLTALGGGEFSILHLDDRAVHVTIKPGEVIKPGTLKRLEGQGMPSYRHHELGDLYVKLTVDFPDTIDPALIAGLESALPPRTPAQTYPENIHVDEVKLSEPTDREKRAHGGPGGHSHSHDDMDDDEEEGAGPQVQCAQQ
ncbi:chaperone regulator [Phaffia rhodozyma]|uniref:Chaperone regulator n=1 Tax=Phaffia rhodozyma TaxID=264483 RepID=A0A0F7SQ44_PHARH|nr:chaperone regulator [Phaffia rhodozyma]